MSMLGLAYDKELLKWGYWMAFFNSEMTDFLPTSPTYGPNLGPRGCPRSIW